MATIAAFAWQIATSLMIGVSVPVPSATLSSGRAFSACFRVHVLLAERMIGPLVALARNTELARALDDAVFELLYTLTKVRGHKTVLKFFSHEAADFHPAVKRLVSMDPKDYQVRARLRLYASPPVPLAPHAACPHPPSAHTHASADAVKRPPPHPQPPTPNPCARPAPAHISTPANRPLPCRSPAATSCGHTMRIA